MKEQLIEYKTAKLAKEKGFDVPVDSLYSKFSDNSMIIDNSYLKTYNEFKKIEYIKTENWNVTKDFTSAPTQSLLQKWLRDEHGINLTLMLDIISGIWMYNLNMKVIHQNERCKTYEQALEKGLHQALKLIK